MDDPRQGYTEALAVLQNSHPGLTVVLDQAPLMEVHHRVTGPLTEAARALGVRLVRIDTHSDPAGSANTVPDPAWRECTDLPEPAAVLLVTDGRGRDWSGPRLRRPLSELAARVPVALLHAFSRPYWPRSAVTTEPMCLDTAADTRPAAPLLWTSVLDAPDASDAGTGQDEVALIPVLEPGPAPLRMWARALSGAEPGWEADVWPLSAASAPPTEGNATLTAGEQVDLFLSTSSSGARELAVRLAQAPVNLPVAEVVQSTVPRTAPVFAAASAGAEIAEVLGGPLMTEPLTGAPLTDPTRSALDFRPGVRREMLERFGSISTMRAVFHTLGVEFKETSQVYQCLSLVESAAPEIHGLDGEEELARAIIPALSEMPGEYRRLASRLEAALTDEGPFRSLPRVSEHPPRSERAESAVTVQNTAGSTDADPTAPAPAQPKAGARSRAPRTRLAYLGDFPPQNLNFTGRDDILDEMHESLSGRPGSSYLLAGSTGIGKTQIAVEYAHRFREEYDLVWWIPSAVSTDIHQAYLRLAERLGVKVVSTEPEMTVRMVNEALETDPEAGKWLLVFDDVPDPEALSSVSLPLGGRGRVLLTSRNQGWIQSGRGAGHVIPKLSSEESVALLSKVCPHRLRQDPDTAALIAERLQYLPLALAQMGALLRDSLMDTDTFLDMLQRKFDDLVDHAEADDQYPLPLAAAWRIQLEDLRRDSTAAGETKRLVLEFIKLCAFFAPRPLPRAFFHRARGLSDDPHLSRVLGDDMMLSRVLRFANRHSLADFDLENNTFQLHATFQSVVQRSLSADDRTLYRSLAHRVLAQSDPLGPARPQNRADYMLLYAHVTAARAWRSRDQQVRNLVINLAEFLKEVGDYEAALELTREAFDAWTDSPSHRFRVWTVRGVCLRVLGDNDTALTEAELMYQEQVALEGPHSDEALKAQVGRASALTNFGDFDEAEVLLREVYERRLESFGEDDEETLKSAHYYATVLQFLSRFEEALEVDQANAVRNRYVFGENGISTLRSHLSVSMTLIALGRMGEAMAKLEDCARRFEAIGAADSPHALNIPLMLAIVQRRTGNYGAALELSAQATENYRRYHLPAARSALLCRSVHMVDLALCGRVDEARSEADEVLALLDRHYRDYHPFPATTRINAGIVMRAAGRYGKALDMDRAAVQKLQRIYGDSRVTVLPGLINIATDLFGLGRVQEALRQDSEAEEMCRRNMQPGHHLLLVARRNHLISRRALGEEVDQEWDRLREESMAAYGDGYPESSGMDEFRRIDCDIIPVAR